MASLCGKMIGTARRNVFYAGRRFATKVTCGDPVEHATGIEKREILARLAGNKDAYASNTMKRGEGTKCQPNEIPSAFDSRLVGCICHEESNSINYMWLYKGMPKRCECGHWFNLVLVSPL